MFNPVIASIEEEVKITRQKSHFFLVVILVGVLLVGILGFYIKKAVINEKTESSQSPRETIITEIDEIVDASHMFGTLLMLKEGKTVYEKSYGDADHERQIPNNGAALYPIASLQKGMTAVMIGQLIREGEIDYDTTIERFYGELENADEITIRDLLDFTSGYVMPEVAANTVLRSEAEQLENVLETSRYIGTGIPEYSNGSYSLLAGIISTLDQQSYQMSLRRRLLVPLEMTDTYFWDELPEDGLVPKEYVYLKGKNYQLDGTVYSEELMSTLLGAGNLYATVADIGKFELGMSTQQLLSEEEYSMLFRTDLETFFSGMGNISAEGNLGGYSSYVYSNRRLGNSLVFLINQTSSQFNPWLLEKLYQKLIQLS